MYLSGSAGRIFVLQQKKWHSNVSEQMKEMTNGPNIYHTV